MTKENKFTGCTIVATGKLEHFTRDGINDKILELGAKPGSSVTKKTDYLNWQKPRALVFQFLQKLNFWR